MSQYTDLRETLVTRHLRNITEGFVDEINSRIKEYKHDCDEGDGEMSRHDVANVLLQDSLDAVVVTADLMGCSPEEISELFRHSMSAYETARAVTESVLPSRGDSVQAD